MDNNTVSERLGSALEQRRSDQGISLNRLAPMLEDLGVEVTRQAIRRWERGQNIRLDQAVLWCEALGTSLSAELRALGA